MATSATTQNDWILILGASSGFGEATSLAFAEAGYNVVGVHLDRRATMPNVERIQGEITKFGRESFFFNVNAADEGKRQEVLDTVKAKFDERKKGEKIRVLLHSLAFGTLKPYWDATSPQGDVINKSNMDMTLDVMAHSLLYWTQDVLRRDLFAKNSRLFAMTSTGATNVWQGYGAVSAAKAALEAHIRQLAIELAKQEITANAICAGVTDTPALRKIPGSGDMVEVATQRNPHKRLTTPTDVAKAMVALARPETYWINGNTIYVDGGEAKSG